MKYILVFPLKCLISLIWVILSLIGVIVFQVGDMVWNGRIKWVFPMELFSMNTNTWMDDEIDPARVYPTVWHWITNGNYKSFK